MVSVHASMDSTVGVMNADDALSVLRMQPSCTFSAVSSIPGWYGQSGLGLPMRKLNGDVYTDRVFLELLP